MAVRWDTIGQSMDLLRPPSVNLSDAGVDRLAEYGRNHPVSGVPTDTQTLLRWAGIARD